MARNDPQVNLRMPEGLKEKLQAASDENGRSLTAEIIQRLAASFDVEREAALQTALKAGDHVLIAEYAKLAYELRRENDALRARLGETPDDFESVIADEANLEAEILADLAKAAEEMRRSHERLLKIRREKEEKTGPAE